MKNLFFLIVLFFTTALSFAQSQVWVSGYTRSNGTYVQGHYRTAPDYTRNNNWTTQGNVNPHTGKAGTLPRSSSYSNVYYKPTSTYSYNRTYTTPTYTYTSTSYTPTYSNTYTTPTYSSTNTLYTGSRGGTYYVNSNGNRTYVRR
jgi:hypothetical protein